MHRTVTMAWIVWLIVGASLVAAQAPGPSAAALDDAVHLGTVATLAPLCGMREEGWAFDLRRATILDATKGIAPDDPALRDAPGSPLIVGALSFAEAEALESFAEASPTATCEPLGRNPDLRRADEMVRAFRALKREKGPSS